jgi:nucleoside-diphosphate-sugar epimerase
MKVVITGGAGFIGGRLAQALLARGSLIGPSGAEEAIDELLLFDQTHPERVEEEPRIARVTGDISDRDCVFGLIDRGDTSVFHLASVVSGGGEKDFDLAMRVNLDGGRHILEALRRQPGQPRLVFASSIAVFGGSAMPAVVGDTTKQTPETTYGITKAVLELLVNDYSRKGFLDGRSARLPTVVIRPGKPNAAASSFVSGVFREPLNGVDMVLPVRLETAMPILGYRAIVEGLIKLHELPGAALGDDRAVSLPSLTVTVAQMIEALKRVAGARALGQITVEPDPFIEAICAGWPTDSAYERALSLGLPREACLDEIIAYYIADYVDTAEAS